MLNGYITTQEAAQKWNISARQVQILCKNNRIEGAVQINRIWLIPAPRTPININHSIVYNYNRSRKQREGCCFEKERSKCKN